MRIPDGKLPFFLKAPPILFVYAKELRNEKSTLAERLLWGKLKAKKIEGYKFRFQHPLGRFIADFYCHQKQVIIEIDGGYHFEKEQAQLDEARTVWLEARGAKIIRFTNEEVLSNIGNVVDRIIEVLESQPDEFGI